MIKCPICKKWFEEAELEEHLSKEHQIHINIVKHSYEIIDRQIKDYIKNKTKKEARWL